MFYTITIFVLFIFSKVSCNCQYCFSDENGLNICHDGGCAYKETENSDEKCVCTFFVGVMNGKSCGSYVNKCLSNPCKQNGKCTSGVGHYICECPDKFHGINCEKTIGIYSNSLISNTYVIRHTFQCNCNTIYKHTT